VIREVGDADNNNNNKSVRITARLLHNLQHGCFTKKMRGVGNGVGASRKFAYKPTNRPSVFWVEE
jgi:hypothetical protein